MTTFLSKTDKSDYIAKWREAVGDAEADRVSTRASTRGSQLHENVEQYLCNQEVRIPKVRMMDISLLKGMIPYLHRISNIKLLESPLYSDALSLAGTVDCIADFDGVPSIIDFKTAGKLKGKEEIGNYFIQTSIYSWMLEERYGIKIRNLVILISQEFGQPQLFIEDRKNWFESMKRLMQIR